MFMRSLCLDVQDSQSFTTFSSSRRPVVHDVQAFTIFMRSCCSGVHGVQAFTKHVINISNVPFTCKRDVCLETFKINGYHIKHILKCISLKHT